jgi:hypothetical protein
MSRSTSKKAPAPQDPALAPRDLAQITVQIRAFEKHTITNIVEIGRLLEEASELCEHGEYMDWLDHEFSWSHSTSLRYRDVYQLSQSCHADDFGNLNISVSALYLVARVSIKGSSGEEEWCSELGTHVRDNVIETARHVRVGYRAAHDIIHEELRVARNPLDELEESEEPKEIESDEAPSIANKAPEPEPEYPRVTVDALFTMSEAISDLDVCLTKLTDKDWPDIISAVGPTRFREIVTALQAVCAAHCERVVPGPGARNRMLN